jgi:hypothetical protein
MMDKLKMGKALTLLLWSLQLLLSWHRQDPMLQSLQYRQMGNQRVPLYQFLQLYLMQLLREMNAKAAVVAVLHQILMGRVNKLLLKYLQQLALLSLRLINLERTLADQL